MVNVLIFSPFAHTRILLSSLLLTHALAYPAVFKELLEALFAPQESPGARNIQTGRGGEGEGEEQGKEGKKRRGGLCK